MMKTTITSCARLSTSHSALTSYFSALCIALPMILFYLLISHYSGEAIQFGFEWIPSLEIHAYFRLDGLSVLLAGLISGVGVLVQMYASAYMKGKANRVTFHLYLSLFMLAMLGLVLADNLLLLFIFWELTTLISFLLIGFFHDQSVARRNAIQAMLLTAMGGLIMLAGFILLGEMVGSYSLSIILRNGANYSHHSWFLPSMLCIITGAFTKSAQWPFHFWLPGAMTAPTPVSAYLHSATMVKAGVYLLLRLLPVYNDHELWKIILCSIGAFTALWCAVLAYQQTDLKLMLAFSTNVILGQLVLLIGIGSSYSVTAALLLIAAHSLYKAGLFMVVGNIDKATGTRERHELAGLKSALGMSFIAAIMTAASKGGLPPSFGFISKEYLYKASLEFNAGIAITMVLVNAIMVSLSLLILIKPFLTKHHSNAAVITPVEHQVFLWLSPSILAILSAIVPLMLLSYYQGFIINPVVLELFPPSSLKIIQLWDGFTTALLLSAITLILGLILYHAYPWLRPKVSQFVNLFGAGNTHFQAMIDTMIDVAQWQTRLQQHNLLSIDSLQFFAVLATLLAYGVFNIERFPALSIDANYYELVLAVYLMMTAVVVVKAKTLLLAVAALGCMGLLTTLVFLVYSAPDVAKTQLLVETLLIVFITIVLRYLPKARNVPKHNSYRRFVNLLISSVVGISVGTILWVISAADINSQISDYYSLTSVSGGHGRNIVNVILVDFRAFDTMGEAIVVVIAALATVAALGRKHYSWGNDTGSAPAKVKQVQS